MQCIRQVNPKWGVTRDRDLEWLAILDCPQHFLLSKSSLDSRDSDDETFLHKPLRPVWHNLPEFHRGSAV